MRKLGLFLFLLFPFLGSSQSTPDSLAPNDTNMIIQNQDDVIISEMKDESNNYNPRRAMMLSAVIPGAGQIYNKQYWKLPILYGLLGTLAYNAFGNHIHFIYYQESYTQIRAGNTDYIAGPPPSIPLFEFPDANLLSESQLLTLQEQFRRDRDYFIILSAIAYGLSLADAFAFSHLSKFNVSDDLAVSIKPYHSFDIQTQWNSGFSATLRF